MVARGNAWPDLVLATLGFVLLPPTLMVAIEAILPRPSQRRYLHLACVGLLTAAFVFQVLKGVLVPGLEACLAVASGAAFAFVYDRGRFVPTVLTVLSPTPVLLLVWLLGFSPASELAWPGGPDIVRGTVPAARAGRGGDLRRAVVRIADRQTPKNRRAALAQLRRSGGGIDLVPQRDHRLGPNHQSGPDDHDRSASVEGPLPIRANHPGSLFDLLGGQYDFNVKGTLAHLCADELCGQTRATWSTRARLLVGSMASVMRSRLSLSEPTDYIGVPPETIERRPATFREFVERIQPGRTLSLHHADLPHSPTSTPPQVAGIRPRPTCRA